MAEGPLFSSNEDTVMQFHHIAKEYVEFIENCRSIPRKEFVRRVHAFLAELYRLGVLLSGFAVDGSDERAQTSVNRDQWANIYEKIREQLAEVNVYWGVWDPADPEDRQVIQGELSSDLADIYQDLSNILPIDDSVKFVASDLWTIRFQFEHHWGQHVISALTALHSLLYGPSYLIEDGSV